MTQKIVTPNSHILTHMIIRLDDGSIAENTRRTAKPSKIELGTQSVSKAFEQELIGLSVGEKKEFRLKPEDAFGESLSSNFMRFPLSQFPLDMELDVGMIVEFQNKNGSEMIGVVQSIEGDQVNINFNHPLAGHPVLFEIEVLEII